MDRLRRAGYVAFKEKGAFAELGRDLPQRSRTGRRVSWRPSTGSSGASFPCDPDDQYLCTWCAYPSVCRKDYVGDE